MPNLKIIENDIITHTYIYRHICIYVFNKKRYNNNNNSMVFFNQIAEAASRIIELSRCFVFDPILHLHRIASLSRCRIRSVHHVCMRIHRCTYAWAFMSVDGASATILCLP